MSRSRDIGTAWETTLVRYFQSEGFPDVERPALSGRNDKGDLINIPGWTLEAKAEKRITLSDYMKELEREQAVGATKYGCVIVKKRYANVSEAYTVMPLRSLVVIMKELRV